MRVMQRFISAMSFPKFTYKIEGIKYTNISFYFLFSMYLEVTSSRSSASPVPPYPGYDLEDSYREPTFVPRVRPEGETYYNRNRGSIGKWAFGSFTERRTPRPVPRCPTTPCKANYNHGKNGTIKPLLNGRATPRPETAPPRIKSEAEPIASVSRGKRMKRIIHKYAQSAPTPRVPRVKPEAEEIAVPHKGGRMDKLIHSYGKLPLSDRGVPRVKVEGEDNANLDKGKRMKTIIHSPKNPTAPPSARAVPRVKPEAEDNAELDKGKRMGNLLHKYARMPDSSRAVPRVKPEGDPNYTLDLGGRMSRLMHEPPSSRVVASAVPRVRYPEAQKILRKSRGQMGRILSHIGRKSVVPVPGYQKRQFERCPTM